MGLVKVFCVVDVQRREKRENICLDTGDEDFQRADTDHQDKAGHADKQPELCTRIPAVDHEAGQHFKQHVAGHHGNEQTQCEAEGANKEGNQLDRENDRDHRQRRSVRNEQAEGQSRPEAAGRAGWRTG